MTNTEQTKIATELSIVLGNDPKLMDYWVALYNFIMSFDTTMDIQSTEPSKINIEQIVNDAKNVRYSKCVKNMRTLRNLHGLTLRELSENIGVNLQQISYIEQRKRHPSEKIIDAYCDFFKVSKSIILDTVITFELKTKP